jgi:hypothetical protein
MTIVRLRGGLFVHCPAPLSPALRAEVEALGPVLAIVAPSLFHHLGVQSWIEAYPQAVTCACPGLEQKRRALRWDRVLGDTPEPEWAGALEQVFFAARTMENEVVFFHRASRTLICADAVFNLARHQSPADPPGRVPAGQSPAGGDVARARHDARPTGGPRTARADAGVGLRPDRAVAWADHPYGRPRGLAARLRVVVTGRGAGRRSGRGLGAPVGR